MLFFSQNRQDYYIEIDSLHTFNILSTTANQTTSNSDNYILAIEETSVTINTSGYPTGLYSVILVADGDIQSSKNLVIQ